MDELGALAVAGEREHGLGTGCEGVVDEGRHLLSTRAGAACEEAGYGSVIVDALDGEDAGPVHVGAYSCKEWRAVSLAEAFRTSSEAGSLNTCLQSCLPT